MTLSDDTLAAALKNDFPIKSKKEMRQDIKKAWEVIEHNVKYKPRREYKSTRLEIVNINLKAGFAVIDPARKYMYGKKIKHPELGECHIFYFHSHQIIVKGIGKDKRHIKERIVVPGGRNCELELKQPFAKITSIRKKDI